MTDEPAGRRRDFTWVPLAAAAAIAIVVVGLTVLLSSGNDTSNSAGQSTTPSGALACPHVYEQAKQGERPWVPSKARGGVDAKTRLAPDLTPEHVVVCAYPGAPNRRPEPAARVRLHGQQELTGDLGSVVDTLRTFKHGTPENTPCPNNYVSTDVDDYLIGVTFAGGTEWVSAPGNRCVGSSNGSFSSPANLRRYAAAAYSAKKWVSNP